jgi:hypothetical protein
MMELSFKFTPLPAELASVCLFYERLMQSFTHTQIIGDIYIKYILILFKIMVV